MPISKGPLPYSTCWVTICGKYLKNDLLVPIFPSLYPARNPPAPWKTWLRLGFMFRQSSNNCAWKACLNVVWFRPRAVFYIKTLRKTWNHRLFLFWPKWTSLWPKRTCTLAEMVWPFRPKKVTSAYVALAEMTIYRVALLNFWTILLSSKFSMLVIWIGVQLKKKDVGRSFQENNQCLKYEVLRSSLLLISLRRMRVYAQHPFKTSHRIIIRFLAMVVCGAI